MTLFLYNKVKTYVYMQETISEEKLMRKFNIEQAKAREMMERLAADDRIKLKNGKWYVLYGVNYKRPEDITDNTDLPEVGEEFNEKNVMKLLDYYGFLSAALINRRFFVSYKRAIDMIYYLEQEGMIWHDGRMWVEVKKEPAVKF